MDYTLEEDMRVGSDAALRFVDLLALHERGRHRVLKTTWVSSQLERLWMTNKLKGEGNICWKLSPAIIGLAPKERERDTGRLLSLV